VVVGQVRNVGKMLKSLMGLVQVMSLKELMSFLRMMDLQKLLGLVTMKMELS